MKDNKKGQGKMLPLIVGAAIGVLLLIYGGTANNSASDKNSNSVMTGISSYDEARYEEEIVKKIEDVCSKVQGAGRVSVAVTLNGTYRAIYAQNIADGSSVKKEYFLVGSGSSESALLLGYSPPEILGVGIVCTGGSDGKVRAEIISLVSALLDLPTNKIYVACAKN